MSSLNSSRKQQLIYFAGFLYALSLHKYVHRDPLDPGSGIQGYLEAMLLCIAFACSLIATRGTRRQYSPSLAIVCFVAFGILAFASSFRSFNPILSFGQAVLFLVVLGIGYVTGEAGLATRFFQAIYWTFTASLVSGLILGATLPSHFALWTNELDGRTRLSVFGTFPGTMGETAGYLVLLSPILFQRSHWISRLFLLFMNFAGGGKTSTATLLLLLAVGYLYNLRVKLIPILVSGLGVLLYLALLFTSFRGVDFGKAIGEGVNTIYGRNVGDQAVNLDGRLDLWRQSIPLLTDSLILGHGFGGVRDVLLNIAEWSGSSHNGFLELGFTGGILGIVIFLIGLTNVFRMCAHSARQLRRHAFLVLMYMMIIAVIGITFNFPSYFGFLILVFLLYRSMQSIVEPLSFPAHPIQTFSPATQ
jgi:O-antigen ligase